MLCKICKVENIQKNRWDCCNDCIKDKNLCEFCEIDQKFKDEVLCEECIEEDMVEFCTKGPGVYYDKDVVGLIMGYAEEMVEFEKREKYNKVMK